ncbi:MAG TPA: hypothetical protein PLV87_06920, partial [Opitutaceae bacterium]|nr:hypothetical protein [Opitutaceae bacterium]
MNTPSLPGLFRTGVCRTLMLLAVGLITFVIGLMKNQERAWTSYLTAFFYFSSLGVGGLFFVA